MREARFGPSAVAAAGRLYVLGGTSTSRRQGLTSTSRARRPVDFAEALDLEAGAWESVHLPWPPVQGDVVCAPLPAASL